MANKIPPIKGIQDAVRRAMMDTDRRLAILEGRTPGFDEDLGASAPEIRAYADAQDVLHSASDQAYADSVGSDAEDHADAQDAIHSTADRLYTDGVDAANSVTDQAYADAQDDTHSTADRLYSDAQDDLHSTADRGYTDDEVDIERLARIAADALKVDKAGDSMSGDLTFTSNTVGPVLPSGGAITWGAAKLKHWVSTGSYTFHDGTNTILDLRYVGSQFFSDLLISAKLDVTDVADLNYQNSNYRQVYLGGTVIHRATTGAANSLLEVTSDNGSAFRVLTDAIYTEELLNADGGLDVDGVAGFHNTVTIDDVPTLSTHPVRKLELDAHLTDLIDAHTAPAISYDGSANSAIVQAWLTGTDIHTVVAQIAGQLYTPDAETTQALIDALNAYAGADPIDNPDVFESDIIIARHLAAGSVIAGKIDAQAVTTAAIAAGAVTADRIATGVIVAGHMEANTITANEIAAGTITAAEIAAGTITATEIGADEINGTHISAASDITIGEDSITWRIEGDAATTSTAIRTSQATWANNLGIWLDASGRFRLGSALNWDGTTLTIGATNADDFATEGYADGAADDAQTAAEATAAADATIKADAAEAAAALDATTKANAAEAAAEAAAALDATAKADAAEAAAVVLAASYTDGEFTPANVNPNVTSISGGVISTGTVNSDRINATDIRARWLTAGKIAAADIVANTITANEIAANTITATEIDADTITGDQMNALTSITVGTNTHKIYLVGTNADTTTAINGGTMTYNSGKGFWLDASGRITLGDTSTNSINFDGTVLEISGEVTANEFTLVNDAGDDAAKLYTDYATVDPNVGTTEDALVFAPLNGVGTIATRLSWNEAGNIWLYTSPDGAANNWDARLVASPYGLWATRNRQDGSEQGLAGFQTHYDTPTLQNWARIYNISHANTAVYTQVAATGDAALVEASNSDGSLLASRLRANQDGSVEIYSLADDLHLQSDQVFFADGTSSLPVISFVNDPNTGFYRSAADQITFTTGGTWRGTMTNSDFYLNNIPIRVGYGSASNPGLSFWGDDDTGFYRNTTNEMTATAGGTWICTFKLDGLNLNYKNIKGVNTITVNEIYADVGSKTDPSYTFSGYTGTGWWATSTALYGSVNAKQIYAMGSNYVYTYCASDYAGPPIVPNTSYWTRIGADHTWGRLETSNATFYFNKGFRVDTGFVGSYNENLLLGEDASTVVAISNDNGTDSMTVYANSTNGAGNNGVGVKILTQSSASAARGGTSGLLWQTNYSTDRHVHGRVYYSAGDQLGFRNFENTLWVSLKALSFVVGSDLDYKDRVRKGRDEHHPYLEAVLTGDRQLAFDNHRGVETIIFDNNDKETLYEWQGCTEGRVRDFDNETDDPDDVKWIKVVHETRDECIENHCKSKDNMARKDHHCDDYECGGTNESPCWLIEKHVDRPGFSAQNVEEFYPKAVDTDFEGAERGIDTYALVAELWNTVDHLIEECEDLREAIAANHGPDAKERPRGGSILPREERRKGKRVTR